ncbi:MAG: ATP-binding protein [Leptolyngbyaceae bacterium]|nr:ATP-binding protein [Leptolyngbyaceae bacterium]
MLIATHPENATWVQEMLQADQSQELQIVHITSLADAQRDMITGSSSLVFLSVPFLGAQELEVLAQLQGQTIHTPLIVLSLVDDEVASTQALQLGAQDYLVKDEIDTRSLKRAVRQAIARSHRQTELQQTLEANYAKFQTLSGGSATDHQTPHDLEQSEVRFYSLVRHASDGIVLLKADGTILYESPVVERQLGYRPEDLIGINHLDLIHPEDREAFTQVLQTSLQSPGMTWTAQYRCKHRDGSWRHIEAIGCNLLNDPSVNGIVLNNRDVTDRYHYEAELRQARDAAEAGNRAKNEFLSIMSHELRTPLNAILGLSTLLRQQIFNSISPKQQEYLTCIHNSGEHLLMLINDILDISKVEAGKEELLIAPVLISELCGYCLSVVQERAFANGLKLGSSIDPQLQVCFADERRLQQMLINLLTNAVKFTRKGEVSLVVAQQVDGITFTVTDTGIGIAPEHLPLIFEPFHQVDSQLNRHFEGTGLGLALTRQLARLHGGDVTVQSTLGQGSQFTLYLPETLSFPTTMQVSTETLMGTRQDALVTSPRPANGRALLIAEDDLSRLLLQDYLKTMGYQLKSFNLKGGTDLLEEVRTFVPGLILLDIQFSDQALALGWIARLRSQRNLQDLPVVVTTAMTMMGDRERFLAAGATDYLSKPLDIAQLEGILARYL